jgi:16S rRNA (guanine1207-N2)-methyltransferase
MAARLSIRTALDSSLINRRISFNFSRISLRLDLSESLFSSFEVDVGTKILLNSLRKNEAIDYSRVLDLGCGYGPIGLFLKAQDPSRDVLMVDRDALAVAFASHNAQVNDLSVAAYPSLDYDRVQGAFSLIASNFPAKAAVKGLQAFVHGASAHLTPGGVLALIVVRRLTSASESVLDNRAIKIKHKEFKRGYSVFHIAFTAPLAQPESGYERKRMTLPFSRKYTVRTAFGLPEFDSLSFGTLALRSLLEDLRGTPYGSVLVLEPGQGHGAIAVMDVLQPAELALASRDLLSLRFAARNVMDNFPIEPRTVVVPYLQETPEQELTVFNVQARNGPALNGHNLDALLRGTKSLIVHGQTSTVQSLLRDKPVAALKSSSYKGHSALLLKPR